MLVPVGASARQSRAQCCTREFCCKILGGFGKGVREILRKAADVLQNKLTRAQYIDEVTWTTKSWLGLQKQRISVVLHSHGNRRAGCE